MATFGHTDLIIHPNAAITITIIAAMYYPFFATRTPTAAALVLSAALALALAGSVLAHEVAHVVTARLFGITTSRIELTILGGHAHFTTPFVRPGPHILTSLAGPAMNLLLAALVTALTWSTNPATPLYALGDTVAYLNVLLGLFNMLPAYPLDGGHTLTGLVWAVTKTRSTATRLTAYTTTVLAVIVFLIMVGMVVVFPSAGTVILVVWAAVVAPLLLVGARDGMRNARRLEALERLSLQQVARPVVVLPRQATTSDAVAASHQHPTAILVHDGEPVTWTDRATLLRVPGEVVSSTPLSMVMVPLTPGSVIAGTADMVVVASLLWGGDQQRPVLMMRTDGVLVSAVLGADLLAAVSTGPRRLSTDIDEG